MLFVVKYQIVLMSIVTTKDLNTYLYSDGQSSQYDQINKLSMIIL